MTFVHPNKSGKKKSQRGYWQQNIIRLPIAYKNLAVLLFMTVLSESFLAFVSRDLMTLTLFTTRHNFYSFLVVDHSMLKC